MAVGEKACEPAGERSGSYATDPEQGPGAVGAPNLGGGPRAAGGPSARERPPQEVPGGTSDDGESAGGGTW